MPVYEFECKKCKKIFEELILNKNEEVCCKECGSKKVERILSACGIISSSRSERSFSGAPSSGCSTCSTKNCSTCK